MMDMRDCDQVDEFSDEQPTIVTAYEPIGREARRQRANRPTELSVIRERRAQEAA